MEQRNELKDLLYEKMSKEQDNFIEKLKLFPPSKNGHRKATKNGMNRSLSFVFERRPHLFHGSLAGDLCRHDIPAKGRNSPEGDSPQHKPIISTPHCQATHLP